MHESFLKDIALVLGVAAVISAVARRFKLPTVLAYMMAGLVIGPYIPIPLFADPKRVESLSEFGVILVMFAVGLEFRLSRFFQVLPTAGITALFEISMMLLVGISLGYLFGWPTPQSLFFGGALCISSTMIVSKVFEERPPKPEVKEHVFGVLVIQDIVAILLLTVFGTFAASSQLQLNELVSTVTKLVSVLVFSVAFGLFVIPKFIRYISKNESVEVITIVATGICFAVALLVESMGYSVALGAFLAGVLISESGEGHKIEHLMQPLKDVFAAIFFVSVGMSVNPLVAIKYWPQALVATGAVILFQFVTVFIGGILSGAGTKKSLLTSLTLGQIGEFGFIIAAIGAGAGLVGEEFSAIVVTVAVLSSLSTPLLWKSADKIMNYVIEKMPNPLRIAIGLYEAWFNNLRQQSLQNQSSSILGVPKKIPIAMAIDGMLMILLPPAILKFLPGVVEQTAEDQVQKFEDLIVYMVLAVIMAPLLYGFIKSTSQLITHLTKMIFKEAQKSTLEREAAKSLFTVTIWSLVSFLIGIPALSALRPFTNSLIFSIVLAFMFLFILGLLWKRAKEVATDFESGGERLISVLKRQTYNSHSSVESSPQTSSSSSHNVLPIPGLENIESIQLTNEKHFGKTLSEMNLRNLTGVTVVSILRQDKRILFPNHKEPLLSGDVIQVWGNEEAKEKCKTMLGG